MNVSQVTQVNFSQEIQINTDNKIHNPIARL